jgi:hypothetical protein
VATFIVSGLVHYDIKDSTLVNWGHRATILICDDGREALELFREWVAKESPGRIIDHTSVVRLDDEAIMSIIDDFNRERIKVDEP